jgi:hypothetical protein
MSLRIASIDAEPFHLVPYLNAGKSTVEWGKLPLVRGRVTGLPSDLDALVITSDLQFVERLRGGAPGRLMGEALPQVLGDLGDRGAMPRPERSGVILAGDLFALENLEDRGGLGDVGPIWTAFARRFRWVAGVLGNHDELAHEADPHAAGIQRTHVLDGTVCEVDGLRIGGVSGILQRGERLRSTEKNEADFVRHLENVLLEGVDFLVLHHGPAVSERRGSVEIAAAIDQAVEVLGLAPEDRLPLIVCGHRHWDEPLGVLGCGGQVLNVEKRVVVLVAS